MYFTWSAVSTIFLRAVLSQSPVACSHLLLPMGDQEILGFEPNLHAGHPGSQEFNDYGLPTSFFRAMPCFLVHKMSFNSYLLSSNGT